jgi:SulP family sulfate permease
LVGVLFSFAFYLFKTSSPRIFPVLPDDEFEHFVPYPADKHPCPQLGILTISGDLYFGAANTVEDTLLEYLADHPSQRFLLLRLLGVNNCDFSGIQMLRTVRQVCLSRGGDLYLVKVQKSIQRILHSTGFYEELGPDHFLEEEQAITYLFHQVIDPAVCIYECNVRAFIECQNLPKQTYTRLFEQQPQVPAETVPQISASALWQALQSDTPPLIIDVRQPREFKRGHIPQAQLRPLPGSLTNLNEYSTEQTLVLVCRSGERSLHLAQSLRAKGYSEVKILQGGLLAWENQELPLMIDTASGNIPVLHLSEKTSKQNGKS